MFPIVDIDIKINGKPIPADTLSELERLHHDIGELIHWLKAAPQLAAFGDNSSTSSSGPDNFTPAPESGNGGGTSPAPLTGDETRRSEAPSITGRKPTVAEYVSAALLLLGGGANYADVLDTMKGTLHWKTRASSRKNALRTIEIAARQRSELMVVGGGVMTLTDKGRAAAKQIAALLPLPAPESEVVTPEPPSHPNFGGRAIDILVLALYEAGKPIAQRDAAALVSGYGWDVMQKSARPDLLVNSKARKYPEFVIAADGRYWLTDKGKRLAQEIKSLRATSSPSIGADDAQQPQAMEGRDTLLFNDEEPTQQARATERPRLNPQPGKQLIDRILHAANSEGGTATLESVVDKMLANGWPTRSKTLTQRRRTAQAALYNFPGYLHYTDGVLTITPQGYERLQNADLIREDQRPLTTQEDGTEADKVINPA